MLRRGRGRERTLEDAKRGRIHAARVANGRGVLEEAWKRARAVEWEL